MKGTEKNKINKKLLYVLLSVVIGVIIALLPPQGDKMTGASMVYLGIFTGMIILLVSQALEDWIVALFALTLMVIFKVDSVSAVFATFGQSIVWLIIAVFALAIAIGNSGLLQRIALGILSLFPPTYRGQVLALMSTGFLISPLIPSTNAKVNLLIPVTTAVTEQVGFKEHSKGALGLFSATYLPAYIGGNAFLTGSVNVAIMLGFMPVALKESLTWIGWLSATWVWLAVILIGTYVYCVTYCMPKEKMNLPPSFMKDKLKELGPMSSKEKFTAIIVGSSLLAWTTQSFHGTDAGVVALFAVAILAVNGLLSARDFIAKIPWTLIVFIGALLSIAGFMSTLGVSDWISSLLGPYLTPLVNNVWLFVPALCIVTFLLRYVVISQMATLAILFAIFSPLMEAAGISIFVLVFVEYISGNVWNVPYQNPFVLATLAIAGDKYVTYKDFRATSYAYMLMCIIGMTASIPLWKLLGLIQ